MSKMNTIYKYVIIKVFMIIFFTFFTAVAQWNPTPNDTLTSYRIFSDNRVQFSIYAPQAKSVLLSGTDISGFGPGISMTMTDTSIWKVRVGPLEPGAYRYNFNVDGISVLDPKNPVTSESNLNSWSLIYLNGLDFMEIKDVPHGAVSEITYFSNSLQRFRRMHVYTPPGYESGGDKYPVLYLLHGAFDCDDSWTTVGRAGFIIDNLIAEGKAEPMIVVMPAGHTGPFRFGQPRPIVDKFVSDFIGDIIPFIENRYRNYKDPQYTAIAGLSMGGAQALNISFTDLEKFGYIGVFSSGIFGITGNERFGAAEGPSWEEKNKVALENHEARENLRLIWFATGKDDFLIETSRATVELLKKYGFDVRYQETTGGHTWINWRNYLHEFTQQIFQ